MTKAGRRAGDGATNRLRLYRAVSMSFHGIVVVNNFCWD